MADAVSYLRVSSKGQVGGDGFPRQREAIAGFAAKRFKIIEEFRDEGISGTRELEHRPGLAALLQYLESNHTARVVLVERADRLARDLLVSEIIVAQLSKVGATVLTSDGADLTHATDDPTRTLIRQVLGAVAQFEKTVLVLKLRAARQRARDQAGRCEGVKPFGTLPGEAPRLERVVALRAQRPRLSLRAIAAQLNTEGIATRGGKPWHPSAVFEIVSRLTARRPRRAPAEPAAIEF